MLCFCANRHSSATCYYYMRNKRLGYQAEWPTSRCRKTTTPLPPPPTSLMWLPRLVTWLPAEVLKFRRLDVTIVEKYDSFRATEKLYSRVVPSNPTYNSLRVPQLCGSQNRPTSQVKQKTATWWHGVSLHLDTCVVCFMKLTCYFYNPVGTNKPFSVTRTDKVC